MAKAFDWTKTCSYDATQKSAFLRHARAVLGALAKELGLAEGTYDLRVNKGGIAVSGEATLHHDHLYVQVSQYLGQHGILMRTCKDRKDYSGGPNNMLPFSALDDVPALAARARRVQALLRDRDAVEDDEPGLGPR